LPVSGLFSPDQSVGEVANIASATGSESKKHRLGTAQLTGLVREWRI
jgi:hypothetical protein